ncbi:MAG: AAA family ATPase, partial [Holophagaceae bacterium]
MYFSCSNFKPYKLQQSIAIKPITLLYGPNSKGKSSIIHALTLFGQSVLNREDSEFASSDNDKKNELNSKEVFQLQLNNSEHNFGRYSDVCHKGNTSSPIIFEIETGYMSFSDFSLVKSRHYNLDGRKRVYRKKVTFQFDENELADPKTGILNHLSYEFFFLNPQGEPIDSFRFSFQRSSKTNRWTIMDSDVTDFCLFCKVGREIVSRYGYTLVPSKEDIEYFVQNVRDCNFQFKERSIIVKPRETSNMVSESRRGPQIRVPLFLSQILMNSDILYGMKSLIRIAGTRSAPMRMYATTDPMIVALKAIMQDPQRLDQFNQKLKDLYIDYAVPSWGKCKEYEIEGNFYLKLKSL